MLSMRQREVTASTGGLRSSRGLPSATESPMLQRRDELARDLAIEQGKPLAEAKAEVWSAAEMFKDAAEDIKRITGEVLPSMDANAASTFLESRSGW